MPTPLCIHKNIEICFQFVYFAAESTEKLRVAAKEASSAQKMQKQIKKLTVSVIDINF